MKCIRNRGDLCETRFEKRSRGGGNRKNRTSSEIDKPNAGKNETYTLAPERESRPSETSSLAPRRESKPSRGQDLYPRPFVGEGVRRTGEGSHSDKIAQQVRNDNTNFIAILPKREEEI